MVNEHIFFAVSRVKWQRKKEKIVEYLMFLVHTNYMKFESVRNTKTLRKCTILVRKSHVVYTHSNFKLLDNLCYTVKLGALITFV